VGLAFGVYETFSQSRREGLLTALSSAGWARETDAVPAEACDALRLRAVSSDWTALSGDGFSLQTAPLDDPGLTDAIGVSDLRFVRHGAGDHGLPPIAEARIGFVLDLNPDWPSQHGGLLMVADGERVRGWRPERGALTLFDLSRPLILSVVSRDARTPRVAVLGRLAET